MWPLCGQIRLLPRLRPVPRRSLRFSSSASSAPAATSTTTSRIAASRRRRSRLRHLPGTVQRLLVPSAALGGRRQEAYVYLPSGYAQHPHRRYPVMYLLHGFPGRPLAFLETVQMGIVDDVLTAGTARSRSSS